MHTRKSSSPAPFDATSRSIRWPRALLVWLCIVVVETIHGILRQLFLTPWIGDLPARQVGVIVGSGLIFGVVWLCIRWIDARHPRQQFAIGALWVALIVAFEVSLGLALGYSRERMLSDYDIAHGGWMGFGLLFLLCAPWLTAKARGLR
jgi:hypothetical protein